MQMRCEGVRAKTIRVNGDIHAALGSAVMLVPSDALAGLVAESCLILHLIRHMGAFPGQAHPQ